MADADFTLATVTGPIRLLGRGAFGEVFLVGTASSQAHCCCLPSRQTLSSMMLLKDILRLLRSMGLS